jgi:hypothetical protein
MRRVHLPAGRLVVLSVLVVAACNRVSDGPALFSLLSPAATGITFVNELTEDPEFNILNYLNYYNGGGVAVGDIDNDGLPDLYFTSNLGSNRLYLNKGDYHFEDITERAGVEGSEGWTSGVTMADVNGDGHIDIYVSAVNYLSMHGRNVLYVNNGDQTFTDRTEDYGLTHVGYSTQAAFFDYDADGDLDMYLLNHSTHEERGRPWNPERERRHPTAGDRLFRNDGDHFVDVSQEAGIYGTVQGYGLGVVVSDLDVDGCPDVYVANDFDESDFLYFNNCDGTFTESLATSMGHTSLSSMGVDAADYNNDGRPDVMVLDMLPEREENLKTSANAESFYIEYLKLRAGYHPQYVRNTLQLNRGRRRFSEIGYLARVYATDWSWAPLFADLDNDGYKDLFVTNGIYRRPNDLDYVSFVGTNAVQAMFVRGLTAQENLAILDTMPEVSLPDYAFRNNGDLTFTNMAEAWGLERPSFSNGAVYADLNNSGVLDLVVNNVNTPASIYRSRAREITGRHYLTVLLHGSGSNTLGIGARVVVVHDSMMQTLEQSPTRGFQSSVDPRLHFGLGASEQIDSLVVIWPDHRYQVLTDVAVDQVITLSQDAATGEYVFERERVTPRLFEDVTASLGVDFKHEENTFFDYNREPLMPHELSREGPALAVGDVNGDGLDDIYVGGAKWQTARLFLQSADGGFQASNEQVFRADSMSEDVDAVFFDADDDGDRDLYVVSAGNEFWDEHEPLLDRLYLNDGQGEFRRSHDALPEFFENGSCVVPGDFNGDGHLDLFVGGRVVSRKYGLNPRSYLLQNDGGGRFSDVTLEKAEALAEAGMVTSATWVDYDHDGQLDLIVVGEWMPIRVFQQRDGRFVDQTAEAGLSETNGWWNTVVAVDLRDNGLKDLVLGNLGNNSYIKTSRNQPARLYIRDFAADGAPEQILTVYRDGESYPLFGRDELVQQVPQLRDRYRTYVDFGASRIEDIFTTSELRQATVLEAYVFANSVAINNGDGTFDLQPLPPQAQFAPIYAALADDFDGDENTDLLVAGNFYGVPPVRGRYDASYGLVLSGNGEGRLEAIELATSNLVIEGEARDMKMLRWAGGDRLIVVARNNDELQFIHQLR